MTHDPKEFEHKWQKFWNAQKIYEAEKTSSKPPAFVVDMFPYPSGSSMHVGHPRGYVATDVYSRYKRMQGYNVLHPMGWDAFGLPAEETAIENKEHPAVTVKRNIEKFKAQLEMLGLGYDWSREINTTDPAYYTHTQRIFLELFKKGLARNEITTVNWCPALGTVLANEDIVDGKSERGGHPVFQQPMRQWVLAITAYADRLVDDLQLLPQWPEKVKNAQTNWIGKSEGHELSFAVTDSISIPVFTTRIETLPGVTFVVLAPEHAQMSAILAQAQNPDEVQAYIQECKQRTDLERQTTRTKSGVCIQGVYATHPLSKASIPLVVADYVLASYGTGAVMAVPGHDERDAEMAMILSLPTVSVVENDTLVNAGAYTGLSVAEARTKISEAVGAHSQKRYKMRDWVFSRQRFWGEPFPILWITGKEAYEQVAAGPVGEWLPPVAVSYTDEQGEHFAVPVLPTYLDSMRLPDVEFYEPTGTLEGPLAGIDSWVHTHLNPHTGEVTQAATEHTIAARRETNTMPQWAGSSWYWLRYMDPTNPTEPFSQESAAYWGPVSVYAGADHAVAHLIYARFWHKVLFDIGMVTFPEPFTRLEFLGYILASDGTKISKRKGNSRSPEDVVNEVGADAFRLYEMFIGPFEKAIPWSDDGLKGTRRFLDRVWLFVTSCIEKNVQTSDPVAVSAIQEAVRKVGEDIEVFKFNTAVSTLMTCMNTIHNREVSVTDIKMLLSILAPFAPHLTEELWHRCQEGTSIHTSAWPTVSASATVKEEFALAVQINGKHRATITVASSVTQEQAYTQALADPKVQKYIGESTPKKIIYVPGKILNVVI